MSHTPGPWMVKHAGNQDEIWSDRGLVAELSLYHQGSKAVGTNARLIAASPDLLAALEAAYDSLCDMRDRAPDLGITLGDDDLKAIAQARAAIAKARGE